MKKSLLVLFIIFFSISLVSALDITLTKNSYYPGETLQAEFPAPPFISTLTAANIGIYKGDIVHKTPAQSGLIRSDNKYFYYAVLPDTPESTGGYSLRIENANHYENNVPTEETIEKNFTLAPTTSSYLSFNPGNIYASNDFSINIKAYNTEQSITVDFAEANFKQTFSLGYGLDKTVYIPISSVNGTVKSSIKINSYSLPAVVIGKAQPSGDSGTGGETGEGDEEEFEDMISISPESIDAPVLRDINFEYYIKITKETSEDLEDIEISSSDSELKPKKTTINLTDEEEILEIVVNSDRNFEGKVILEYNGEEVEIPVNVTIVENESGTLSGTPSLSETKTCVQKGGVICDDSLGETCSGIQEFASDYSQGVCCIGTCEIKESSSGWIWGILILIILGAVGWYLYQKSKGGPGLDALSSVFKKKTESYEKRIRPSMAPPSVEVRKSLSKD